VRGVVFNGELEVTDGIEVRDPNPDEVIVRISAAGVCHSDLSVVNGTIPFPTPVVLGHEGAGIVEEVGSNVSLVKPGDTVVLTTLGNCGRCPKCETGRPTQCPETFGKLTKPFTVNGKAAYSFANTSVFVERTVVKESQAVPIDTRVPLDKAALIGCAVLTGAGAVFNRARVGQGDSVAVFGVGGIGLNAIQASFLAGATTIVAVDMVAAKEKMAREFGATHFIDASVTSDTVKAIQEIVPGGVTFSFEAVGHPAVMRNAIDCVGWGGSCVMLGVPPLGTEVSFVAAGLYNDKAILGCRYGTSRPRADIPMLADLYLAGRLKLDELVTRTYPLDEIQTVFDDVTAGSLARGVLTF
jgi:S-(hydroxymethyl)glutathione dehydrogenase/alcohol dehydrogenase